MKKKISDEKWHAFTNGLNNGLQAPARLSKDGRRVLCSGLFRAREAEYKKWQETGEELTETELQNLLRCGGELGQIEVEDLEYVIPLRDGRERVILYSCNVFLLPADFGPGSDTIYRKTKRAHHRMFGPEKIPEIIKREYGGAISCRFVKGERKREKEISEWGEGGVFVLPITIRCPKCKGLNFINDQLIKGAPLPHRSGVIEK